MNRREFLKTVTAGAAGIAYISTPSLKTISAAALSLASPELEFKGKLLRGTRDGRVLESTDGGKTWKALVNFGKECEIQALFERNGEVYAQVGLQKFSFVIHSGDTHVWLTANAIPA